MEFPQGLPKIDHAIAMIETRHAVNLNPQANELPLEDNGTPISYFSLNDFLNLTIELRTVPELIEYLNQRRCLSEADLRCIGEEQMVFDYYFLNNGSFQNTTTREQMIDPLLVEEQRLAQIAISRREARHYSQLLEDVAYELSTRLPNYEEGLPPEVLSLYEPTDKRSGYLKMQEIIGSLRLSERVQLGRAFEGVIRIIRDSEEQDMTFMCARLDTKPSFAFVLGASKGIERAELCNRMLKLARAAMGCYNKHECLVIFNRDNEGFEVLFYKSPDLPQQWIDVGRQTFGFLRDTHTAFNLVPPELGA